MYALSSINTRIIKSIKMMDLSFYNGNIKIKMFFDKIIISYFIEIEIQLTYFYHISIIIIIHIKYSNIF